ncbi:phage portal protein [Enterococcus durans]|uniref:phage portal protein n=2 Tax=Enterococcus durans TaxID=53345 RepID=UPI00101F4CD7|nr:phage portal protein [Enterococcus durans]MZG90562.1 phage portal protein [Enterococcus durans]MZG93378.1 phage portal protein [Enterococcus durans]MZH20342.1 phage portal protein [Enterococcus durans]MZH23018.1 phage portal protein [Enterococcus durans]MZH25744.1 phage portal protein [Enterococcus durans]
MGLFFKTEKRSLSSRSSTMLDFISTVNGNTTINFDGETALEQSDVFTAVKILAGDIAASKFKFSDNKQADIRKLDMLNKYPNASMTPYSFMFATIAQMLLSGNSFAIIHEDWLEFAKPSQVVVYEDLETGVLRYEYTNKAGTSYKVDSSEMLHFKYVTVNGKTGISPLDALKTELSMLDNGNKMLSSFFKKGIQAGGVLKLNKGTLNNKSKKQIKQDFEEVNSGASNANSVIVLDDTQEFKQFEINTDILKMIQNNVYSTKQIAKAFGIPLSRFGMELVNTKDDAANDVYVSSTLRALSRMITDELFVKLGINVELDFSTLTGQDMASRMNKAMDGGNGGDGYLLVNEIRNYYGLADIPGGDIIYTKTTAKGGVNSGNGNSEPSGSSIRGEPDD